MFTISVVSIARINKDIERSRMNSDKNLIAAYALETPADNKKLYAEWATTYESSFAVAGDYQLPKHVAETFAKSNIRHNILDVGAGTGLLGILLKNRGFNEIDGIDISPQMLLEAKKKCCYRELFEADLTQPLKFIPDKSYRGIVSSGTFTNGHLGPSVLDELLRVAEPNAVFTLSVNANHWQKKLFDEAFNKLAPKITNLTVKSVQIYGGEASGPNKDDICHIVQFLKS